MSGNPDPTPAPSTEPEAVLDGRFVPASKLTISVTDAGFVQGTTVAEQLRTFGGELFRLEAHLDRLDQSLAIIGLESPLPRARMTELGRQLVARNHRRLAEGDDLGLSIFVTPGPYPTFMPPGANASPTLGMHTYPLPFHLWAEKYRVGQSLRTTSIRQVPGNCWPPELKCRSRMHYFLADRRAAAARPGARALVLDADGHVTESSTANVVAYFAEENGLVSPPREAILPGISLEFIVELAADGGLGFRHAPLTAEDLTAADEVLLSSTSPCVVPVVEIDGRPIGAGRPGRVFRELIDQWGRRAGLDIAAQAERFAQRVKPAELEWPLDLTDPNP